jgi:hypothetical protein
VPQVLSTQAPGSVAEDEEGGCAYLFEGPTLAPTLGLIDAADGVLRGPEGSRLRRCGLRRRRGSSYCPRHHALCHLRPGSAEETRRLEELERLAQAVGGRSSSRVGGPSRHFLERLENRDSELVEAVPRGSFESWASCFFHDEELQ